MNGSLLIGVGPQIRRVPDDSFVQSIRSLPAHMAARLSFMTKHHHAVRDFVVREMPRQAAPISPEAIAKTSGIDPKEVSAVLSDLEKNLFFLVRNPRGNVEWAFPVTTAVTAHKLTFSTGENTYGA
jgi:hypothetical protein